ncbi:hypothetical protein FF38_05594 [Lucilia cuprina]|uniref:Uncharacterized protein n=1 Tax=Lucilia cuprina TaxID=7375 RepID=A0A0L0BXC8_LUCCU|nr:hypothetical protein FF38_05594 [Lucilia cuprina]
MQQEQQQQQQLQKNSSAAVVVVVVDDDIPDVDTDDGGEDDDDDDGGGDDGGLANDLHMTNAGWLTWYVVESKRLRFDRITAIVRLIIEGALVDLHVCLLSSVLLFLAISLDMSHLLRVISLLKKESENIALDNGVAAETELEMLRVDPVLASSICLSNKRNVRQTTQL